MSKTKNKKSGKVTPLMKQYFSVKQKYPDAILLFRVGDFYETFGEDAVTASQILGIILTKRNNGGSDIELAGFPHHSMDLYLPRLVKAGYRVAICEQLEKPSPEKKIVKRGVTEVVTPGVATGDKLLDHKSNNYLCAIHFYKKNRAGVAFADISTGEFLVSEGDITHIDKLIQGFNPSEVLFAKGKSKDFENRYGDKYYTFPLDEWVFTEDFTREKLLRHFDVNTLKGYGIEELELAQIAAGTILHYLDSTENKHIKHVNSISRVEPDRYVWLDRFTIRNLELIYSNHESGIPLINILDKTISPMGARLLKKWVVLPLKSKEAIESRLDVVDYALKNVGTASDIEQYIKQIGDLERIISKVALGKINPREVVQLQKALSVLTPVKEILADTGNEYLIKLGDALNPCAVIREQIATQIIEEPPVNLHKGGVIAEGVDEALDDYRNTSANAKDLLVKIQETEAEKTGITSLKIGFNNVFGYYLEVTNKYKDQGLIPDDWVRKQTLKGSERYITDELKKLEAKILGAEEKILDLEERIFNKLIEDLSEYIQPIQHNASVIARIDCLLSFAKIAQKYNYCRPEINDGFAIDIKKGRHPVIEQQLPIDDPYVPNDVFLDKDEQQILMITGPNMAGKSALLRQVALITLMAQMGSFVPAESAKIGWVDKVFTRVGASDNISGGESTFMVEMNETASIMNNISDRSLVLLDEIGRGTSTYDGVSIAWSIAEYLHENGVAAPKTLFATHYHELNELAAKFPRIKNCSIAIKQIDQRIIFLRKLIEGGSNHSFGIYVAKMAGMPRSIIERAQIILNQLETKMTDAENENGTPSKEKSKNILQQMEAPQNLQLSIFETVDPSAGKIKEALEDIDLNSMTPIDCMLKLNELKKILEE